MNTLIFWLKSYTLIFAPKWEKEAYELIKAARRYYRYNKDLISNEQTTQLLQQTKELYTAFQAKDKELTETLLAKLHQFLEKLPNTQRQSLTENVESFFVILAIFFGIRTYIVQPFRIPTGSMQPSLNGIRATPCIDTKKDILQSTWDLIAHGRSHVKETAQTTVTITDYQDASWLLLSRTNIIFNDGNKITVPAPPNETERLIYALHGSYTPTIPAGEDIINAYFDSGDVVLVNKFTYNFRQPKRGEVFVFDTRFIDGIHRRMGDQAAGDHYIKRLVGIPGDTLQVNSPNLLINGQLAQEKTIQRVAKGQAPYNAEGYVYATPEYVYIQELDGFTTVKVRKPSPNKQYISSPQSKFTLHTNKRNPLLNEYAAFGDNSLNSLDSRYWGPVKQYNIVGPGSFTLWPLTDHWGIIP